MKVINETFFIQGNVPSLKNSKIKTSKGIFSSKTVTRYIRTFNILKYSCRDKYVNHKKNSETIFYNICSEAFSKIDKTRPIQVYFHFIRNSRHKFDFHNATQIIADLFTAYDFIEDDNMDYFIPFPLKIKGEWYSYDKNNPGVIIKIKQLLN